MGPSAGRVFEGLLAAIGCGVEEDMGVRQGFGAAGVGRVGVEDGVVQAEENA